MGEIIGQCHQAGFDTIIVADPALLLYIRSQKIPCRIHLSGEFGEINSQMADFLEEMEICRVIFHRKKYSGRYEILYFQSKKEYRVRGVCPK